jgi:hypothetical protein
MNRAGKGNSAAPRIHIVFVILLAVLVLFGTTVQSTHYHADGLVHADCAICHTAPHAVEVATGLHTQQAPVPSTRVTLWTELPRREHLFSFDHWNKPPPGWAASVVQS